MPNYHLPHGKQVLHVFFLPLKSGPVSPSMTSHKRRECDPCFTPVKELDN